MSNRPNRATPQWEKFLTILKVLRYSALLFGIFYGFQHQRSLDSAAAQSHKAHEYQKKTDLIEKAKLEWKKKSMPAQSKTEGGDSK